MKRFVTSLFMAGSLLMGSTVAVGAPVDVPGVTNVQGGAFAGARFRIPLGGTSTARPRLSLTVAPIWRGESGNSRAQMRFGEGVAFGFSGGERASLSVAGKPLSTFSGRQGSVDRKNASGVSTLGTVALVGAGVLVALGVALLAYSEAMDCDEDEECS